MPATSPASQQRAFSALSKLSRRDLAILWPKLNLNAPVKLAEPLSEIVTLIVTKYGLAAASLAADFYDESRAVAKAPGRFTAITAPVPTQSKVDVLSRWAVGPLFGANPDGTLALSLVGGGLQRMVAGMGRDTTAGSVAKDPAKPHYARHASANACAFCAMLATRGPVYKKETATTMLSGTKYHDDCHCIAVAVWPGQDYEPPPYVKKWDQAYIDASSQSRGTGDILAHMRESLGTN